MVPRRGHSGDEEWSVNGMLKGMLKGMGKHIPFRALRGGWPKDLKHDGQLVLDGQRS
jgi:hypothetical protein